MKVLAGPLEVGNIGQQRGFVAGRGERLAHGDVFDVELVPAGKLHGLSNWR